MKLKVINSNSAGNCYLFIADNGEALIMDCGVRFQRVKEALGFDFSKVAGICVTHSHGDHSKGVKEALDNGLKIYTSKECAEELKLTGHHNITAIEPKKICELGTFKIMPFDLKHDVRCYGYLINHPECGITAFITDTFYIPNRFTGLHNILVEANYDQQIVDENLKKDKKFLRDRVLQSHMELQTTKEFLLANDLTTVNNIVLIHLSDRNSNATDFKQQIELATNHKVTIATAGLEIPFNKRLFENDRHTCCIRAI